MASDFIPENHFSNLDLHDKGLVTLFFIKSAQINKWRKIATVLYGEFLNKNDSSDVDEDEGFNPIFHQFSDLNTRKAYVALFGNEDQFLPETSSNKNHPFSVFSNQLELALQNGLHNKLFDSSIVFSHRYRSNFSDSHFQDIWDAHGKFHSRDWKLDLTEELTDKDKIVLEKFQNELLNFLEASLEFLTKYYPDSIPKCRRSYELYKSSLDDLLQL